MFGNILAFSGGAGAGGGGGVDLTQDQISHFLLNNNVDDSYGTYDGDLFNGVDLQGDRAYCDGVDDYMTMPINTALAPFNQTNFEVGLSFWFHTDVITNNKGICQWGDVLNDGTPFLLLKYDTSGILKFYTESVYTTVQTSLTPDTMNHIFMTRSDTDDTWRIYLNGVLKATYTNANVSYSYGQKIFLGNGFGGYTNHSFSNVRVYNAYKDQTFVDALYAEGYYPKTLTAPTTDGLIARFKLTGTGEDTLGNYNGTEEGSPLYSDDEVYGSSIEFDGTDDAVRLGAIPVDDPLQLNNDFTIICFLRPDRVGDDIQRYISKSNNSNAANGYDLTVLLTGQLKYYSNGLERLASSGVLSANVWAMIAYTYVKSTNTLTLEIDNVFDNSATASGINPNTQTNMSLGMWNHSIARRYNGNLREAMFYNRALTSQEKTDIHLYLKNFRSIDIDDGLVCFYPLGTNSLDNYYNQHDGVDTSMTYNGLSGVFNGVDSNIIIPYNNMTSFSFWFKTTDTGKGFVKTTDTSNPNTQTRSYSADLDTNGSLRFYYYDGSTRQVTTTTSGLNDNTWHHVFISRDGTTIYIYVDNVLVATNTVLGTLWASGAYTVIGMGTAELGALNGYYVNGLISKARFYPNHVSEDRIGITYNEEKGDFGL